MPKSKRGLLITLIIIALIALVAALQLKRQAVEAQLGKLTVDLNQQQQLEPKADENNKEIAQQIVDEVSKLIDIPSDVEPTVATIVDIDALRAQNPFYNKAENGDYLIVTSDRAILYSASLRIILDVVPVQLEPAKAPGSAE